MNYVGRLAPSPTGAQHLGNARTFLVAWLACRQLGGKLLLRIEDLDTPRTKPGATEQAIEDLKWLGLNWDTDTFTQSYTIQSDRESRYAGILAELKQLNIVYPCTCSRSEIDETASAPHESTLDGAIYPGICSHRTPQDSHELDQKGLKYAWRFRMPDGLRTWNDQLFGSQILNAKEQLGDFVVGRNYGATAYQLAVVVDDHDFGINQVVRGNDLIYSTYRQIAIYDALQWRAPNWLHLPLMVGADGRRLAKRHGDTRLSFFREQSVAPEQIVGYLAKSIGLRMTRERICASELLIALGQDQKWLQHIEKSNTVFVLDDLF